MKHLTASYDSDNITIIEGRSHTKFECRHFIAAAAVTAAGIANVKSILSTPDPTPPAGLGASGGGQSMPAVPSSTPPAFNVVGQGGTSQLADAIGGQSPMRAYVVSNDVTTAQGLDRNIVEGATI